MEILQNINMRTKDILRSKISATKMKEAIGTTIKINGVAIYSDDKGVKVCAIKSVSGENFATNSKTFIESVELVLHEPDWVEKVKNGSAEIEVMSGKSNAGRDFVYADFPNL